MVLYRLQTPSGLKELDKHKATLWHICSCHVSAVGSGVWLLFLIRSPACQQARHEKSAGIRFPSDQHLFLGRRSSHLFLWLESLAVTRGWKIHLSASAANRIGRTLPSKQSTEPTGRRLHFSSGCKLYLTGELYSRHC